MSKFFHIFLLVLLFFFKGFTQKRGKPLNKNSTDLFHLKLNYEINTLSNAPRFNGAISSTQWRTKAGPRNAYTYHYDSRDQLVEANYWEATNSSQYVKSNEFQTAPITYDLNGNILSLKRQDELNSLIIDDLNYVYEVDNQLLSVEEVGDLTEGFHADQSVNAYQYDLNGNLISDQSKNITNVEYNHLNLPRIISFSDGSQLRFQYTSLGEKLSKEYNTATTLSEIKNYCSEIQYADLNLEAIYHENGRSVSNASNWQEEFFIADHLGSPRVYFADLNDNYKIESSELLQEQHYYPFGMTIPDATAQVGIENPYQYNNKEFSGESNLNWYDYGARYYDPAIGRWGQVDPMAEAGEFAFSSYNYVRNNPINLIDPDGRLWADVKEIDNLKSRINSRLKSIEEKRLKYASELGAATDQKDIERLEAEIKDINLRKAELNKSLGDIELLGNDQNHTYDLVNNNKGEKNYVYKSSRGTIKIYGSSEALHIHEIKHVALSLKSPKGLVFRDGYLIPTRPSGKFDEMAGYKAQYGYRPNSLPLSLGKSVNYIWDITGDYLGGIVDSKGDPIYRALYDLWQTKQQKLREHRKRQRKN